MGNKSRVRLSRSGMQVVEVLIPWPMLSQFPARALEDVPLKGSVADVLDEMFSRCVRHGLLSYDRTVQPRRRKLK